MVHSLIEKPIIQVLAGRWVPQLRQLVFGEEFWKGDRSNGHQQTNNTGEKYRGRWIRLERPQPHQTETLDHSE